MRTIEGNRGMGRAIVLAGLLLGWFVAPVRADDAEFDKRASWAPPSVEAVRGELEKWFATQTIDDATRQKIVALWPAEESLEGPDLLERVVETLALVVPTVRETVESVRETTAVGATPKVPALENSQLPPLVLNNLRLFVGQSLAQREMYDEALDMLGSLQPTDVVDPASLLFYQSIGHYRLLQKDKCLPTVAKLMENEAAIPRRYVTLARLMDADLRPLKVDSLDEVSRLMDDIARRLDFGRAGTTVRKEEDDVIAKLDKMIEELEKQQQQQQQQGSGSGNSSSPSSPKQESTPGGVQGPGNVDPRNIGNRAGWGNLPPKERQEVLQQISKDLPAHYREAIEEYFRKLAKDGVKK